MFKVYVLIALAIAGVAAQEANEAGASPEPYSYGYETESHAASEQRDPQGRVTGFYNLVDADGRTRRVEYYADETGFHAKVATNEVGTKSQNSADVEVVASPPTEAQFAQQVVNTQQAQRTFSVQQQQQPQQYVTSTSTYQQPAQQARYVSVQQQPQTVGYTQYSGYPGYGATYGSSSSSGYGVGYGSYGVGNYNNHLPSQYYRSVQTSSSAAPVVTGGVSRYVSTVSQQPAVSTYRSFGYENVPGSVTYSAGSVPAGQTTTTTRTVSSSSNLTGSSNYLVLKK